MGSIRLECNRMAWVKEKEPNVNYRSGNYATGLNHTPISGGEMWFKGFALLEFDELPDSVKYKPLVSIEYHQYAQITGDAKQYGGAHLFAWRVKGAWNEETVTYNTDPGYVTGTVAAGQYTERGTSSIWFVLNGNNADRIASALNQGMRVSSGYYLAGDDDISISTRYNTNAALRPYIIVYYEDESVHLIPAVQESKPYFNPHRETVFQWKSAASAGKAYAEPVQTSVRLLYKLPTESEWTVGGSISGSDTSLTVAANTFPITEELQWKIELTDSGGTTTESEVQTSCTKDQPFTAIPGSPVGGFRINETVGNLFIWQNMSPNGTAQSRADLQWSNDGTSWTDLSVTQSSYAYYNVPADTFPVAATLYWRVRSYNADGLAGAWSEAASFSTVDTVPVATPEHPSGTVERGTAPIVFRWDASNESGSLASASELQYRIGSGSWTELVTVQGSVTTYTAPADTFSGGNISWRVRATNRQGTAGVWSAAKEFVCLAAPSTPIVSCNCLPQCVIEWQTTGQNGYKIEVDGVLYGPFFGTGKRFEVPDFLPDGEHRARVSVIGQYGLWSNPGELVFSVANEPGDAVTLSGSFAVDAELDWVTEGEENSFYVYRDGKRIGHTDKRSFLDRFTLGEHLWQVANALSNGNVTWSNSVTGKCAVSVPMISLATGGDWQALRLTANSACETIYNWNQTSSLRHFSGSRDPVLEVSEFEDLRVSLQFAFKTPQEAAPLEAMRGKIVALKLPDGEFLAGGLISIDKTRTPLYISYSVPLERAAWEDYVNDAES